CSRGRLIPRSVEQCQLGGIDRCLCTGTHVAVHDIACGGFQQLFDLFVQFVLGFLFAVFLLVGLFDQPVCRGEDEAADEHGSRCQVEGHVVGVVFGEFTCHPGGDAAAEEPYEVVGGGGDRPRYWGHTHHGGGDQGVVHADEGATDHDADHHHGRVLHPGGDDGQVDRHQYQRRVDGVGATDAGTYPWCHENGKDRDQYTPAEEDEAEGVHADL